jgi:hypothetical protein
MVANLLHFMVLEKELETFQRELPNLLADEGKFAVVFGDQILGIYTSYEDALTIGYEKCGLKPFLVKEIRAIEQVRYFIREVRFLYGRSLRYGLGNFRFRIGLLVGEVARRIDFPRRR